MSESETETVTVSEDKFQGTGIYTVEATDKDTAKRHAELFFREEYGHSPSRTIAEQRSGMVDEYWEVVVTDQSSGSLKGSKEYTQK